MIILNHSKYKNCKGYCSGDEIDKKGREERGEVAD